MLAMDLVLKKPIKTYISIHFVLQLHLDATFPQIVQVFHALVKSVNAHVERMEHIAQVNIFLQIVIDFSSAKTLLKSFSSDF